MIPACFSSSKSISRNDSSQGLITSIYQSNLCNSPTYITLTWSKTLFSHSLTIHAPDFFSITISLYPSTFPFFRIRPGSKSIYRDNKRDHTTKIKLYWDFSHADLINSAEPQSGFYIAVTCKSKVDFFLGDLADEFYRRSRSGSGSGSGSGFNRFSSESTLLLLSRREHVFGHRSYTTKAKVLGSTYEIGIECGDGMLKLKIDSEIRLVVKRLAWKFRGNERIMIGGIEVEFYWDVFNWINKRDMYHKSNGNSGYGVFVFQFGDGGIWPEMIGAEKKLMTKNSSSVVGGNSTISTMYSSPSPSPSSSSVLQWAEESSDCGRSSSFSSSRSYGSVGGFSLLLYAWRKDQMI